MEKLATAMHRTLTSTKFFVATCLLFAVQSVWLAATAIYPLPFDEFVHVGTIQLYAKQWLPVITQQPPDMGYLGDVTREPSFLYHYLLSFPYRLLDLFVDNQALLVVAMRFFNIAFVVGTLILFRKLLLSWGLSRQITHVALLAFVCTPIVPFLAAHVNYDNLMLLLTPLFLLLATSLLEDNRDLLRRSLSLVLVGTTTLLVKQTFLPLLIAVAGYVAFCVWRRNGRRLPQAYKTSWRQATKGVAFTLICAALMVVFGLFAERYGGNLARYGSIRPACDVVQSRALCENYGPWYRDNIINVQNRPAEPPYGNPLSFSQYWASRMMRGFFAIFMHTPTQVVSRHEPFGPIQLKSLLPLPVSAGYFALLIGSCAVWLQRRRLWQVRYLRFGMSISLFYLAVLWLFNYQSYLSLWKGEAIQARYVLPILLILFVLMIQALCWSITDKRAHKGLLLLFAVFYVWGGGITGWLVRAEDTWRWQHPTVQSVNRTVQKALESVVIH